MNTIIKIAKFIIDARLLISFAAVALTLSTFRIFDTDFDWPVICLVFLSTILAYTFPLFLKQASSKIKTGCFIAYFIASFTVVYLLTLSQNPYAWAFCALLCVITLFYYLPLPFTSFGTLRNIPYMKIFIISFSWTIATVCLPLLFEGNSILNFPVLFLMIERFLFILAITIPFDVRDLKLDKEGGLLTIPSKIGMKKSLLLASFLLLAYLAISICHYGFSNIVFVRALCVLSVLILIQRINRTRSTYYYTGLLDGSMIFQSLLMHIMV